MIVRGRTSEHAAMAQPDRSVAEYLASSKYQTIEAGDKPKLVRRNARGIMPRNLMVRVLEQAFPKYSAAANWYNQFNNASNYHNELIGVVSVGAPPEGEQALGFWVVRNRAARFTGEPMVAIISCDPRGFVVSQQDGRNVYSRVRLLTPDDPSMSFRILNGSQERVGVDIELTEAGDISVGCPKGADQPVYALLATGRQRTEELLKPRLSDLGAVALAPAA